MSSIISTEIKASILRHRLFDRLAGRTDIVDPANLAPALARHIPIFLVAGLDDWREPGTGGWAVLTGGLYAKLCFSPVLDDALDNAGVAMPYRLPLTQADYIVYVETITGLGSAQAADLARLFRFDPAELFDLTRALRRDCPPAWRLLLSNEFTLATALWPDLLLEPPGSQFRYPLVDAFRAVARLECAVLIMRHLARARAILDRPRFLEALASPLPLATWFRGDQLIEVYRWIEYATLSSAALADLLFDRDAAGVLALPASYAPWALARGELPAAAATFHDHPEVRKAVAKVFTRPALIVEQTKAGDGSDPHEHQREVSVERRKSMLRNDEVVRWYGMTSEALPIIALDDVRTRFPTRRVSKVAGSRHRVSVGCPSRVALAALGSAMRDRADPAMQARIVQAAVGYLQGSKLVAVKTPTLERNVKLGLKLALACLPPADSLGGAARFDPLGWKAPRRDAELWRMLLDPRRGGKLHRLRHPDRRLLRTATGLMRRAYAPLFASMQWSDEVERVVCDMAVGLSPISVDPHIAFAIHTLGQKPGLRLRLSMQLQRSGYGRRRA